MIHVANSEHCVYYQQYEATRGLSNFARYYKLREGPYKPLTRYLLPLSEIPIALRLSDPITNLLNPPK
jgi:hypothetical protein